MKNYFTYREDATREISFPLGGIGSGSVGLAGNGSFIDWEIFNHADKGSRLGYTHLAVKASRKGKTLAARVLQGDVRKELIGQYSKQAFAGYGYGPANTTMQGFPHFRDTVFEGQFPIARMTFGGEDFPAELALTAFNPMIPGRSDDSSIPAAFLTVTVKNTADEATDYTVAFSVKNPWGKSRNTACRLAGHQAVFLTGEEYAESDVRYGDMTLVTDGEDTSYNEYWYRGGWNDALETYWRGFTEKERLEGRTYTEAGNGDMATLAAHLTLKPGEEKNVRFVLAWNQPNRYNDWSNPEKTPDQLTKADIWKNYYAVLYKNSKASAEDAMERFESLLQDTRTFRNFLFDSTLPDEAVDAVASTLSVLKSPTVLRLEDGSLYGWEGVHELSGSCEGTCTHVWSYAYALCFLFPDLERSLRENDYRYNAEENGRMGFRMMLPAGSGVTSFRACVDGQMAGIVKTYREWKISGDTDWLKTLWPRVKKALAYAWSPENEDRWDADCDGYLEGRQHHTLDMELFSASSWLEGMYLSALLAAAEMAKALGDGDEALYRRLFESGREKTEENLFNGQYYIQKIDLKDKNLIKRFESSTSTGDWNVPKSVTDTYWNEEAGEIKYQIGEGCEIDQMLGQWHANINGLGTVFDRDRIMTALENMMKNNYKESFRNFYNPFRLFAVNDDRGTVMCDYPEGAEKPAIPVPYCQETMHGFEYAFAGLLMQYGRIEDAFKVIKAVRDRYRGYNRNPWNEIECGNNYARSMAAFAILPIMSGMTWDMTRGELGFAPKEKDCRSFFALGEIWGQLDYAENRRVRLTFAAGSGRVKTLILPIKGKLKLTQDGVATHILSENGRIGLDLPVCSLIIERED